MDIVEGKPGSLSAGAGFSSTDGLVGQVSFPTPTSSGWPRG